MNPIEPTLSARQWFAGQALVGLLSVYRDQSITLTRVANDAYAIADAMLDSHGPPVAPRPDKYGLVPGTLLRVVDPDHELFSRLIGYKGLSETNGKHDIMAGDSRSTLWLRRDQFEIELIEPDTF